MSATRGKRRRIYYLVVEGAFTPLHRISSLGVVGCAILSLVLSLS